MKEEKTITPSGILKGLGKAAIKSSPKIVKEYGKTTGQAGLLSKIRPIFKGIGVKGFATVAIVLVATTIAYWAINQAKEKMGPASDLSRYLPNNNKVILITAPYSRHSREGDPYFEPNVVADETVVDPPQSGILAFGFSLKGLPPEFSGTIDVNELGEGNSDWLCEPYGGYMICRSTSGAYPLIKGLKSVVGLQFHLPEYEVKKMLAERNGSRSIYLIIPR